MSCEYEKRLARETETRITIENLRRENKALRKQLEAAEPIVSAWNQITAITVEEGPEFNQITVTVTANSDALRAIYELFLSRSCPNS